MSDDAKRPGDKHPDTRSETALDEVLREIEEAERRTDTSQDERHHNGEAAEAITPNTRAQQESEGD